MRSTIEFIVIWVGCIYMTCLIVDVHEAFQAKLWQVLQFGWKALRQTPTNQCWLSRRVVRPLRSPAMLFSPLRAALELARCPAKPLVNSFHAGHSLRLRTYSLEHRRCEDGRQNSNQGSLLRLHCCGNRQPVGGYYRTQLEQRTVGLPETIETNLTPKVDRRKGPETGHTPTSVGFFILFLAPKKWPLVSYPDC